MRRTHVLLLAGLAALVAFVLLFLALKPADSKAAPAPKAHASYIVGPTVCGFWAKQSVYIPCRYGYMLRRVRDHRNILAGTPLRRDFRFIYTSLAQTGDYGPNSWYQRFRIVYNEPGPLHRARTCRATMIVNARNGKVIRLQSKSGRC